MYPTLQAALERRAAIEAEELQLNEARDRELQTVREAEAAENVGVPAAAQCWLLLIVGCRLGYLLQRLRAVCRRLLS